MVNRSTWIVISIFVLLLAVFLLYQRMDKPVEEEEILPDGTQIEESMLLEISPDQYIASIRIADTEGNQVEIERENAESEWVLIGAEDGTTDVAQIDSTLDQILTLKTQGKLDPAPTLDAIGLDKPIHSIKLILNNRILYHIKIGDTTITGNSLYVQVNNREPQVVSKYPLDQAINMLTTLPILPTATPELPTEDTTSP